MKKVGHQPFPHTHDKKKLCCLQDNSNSQAKVQDMEIEEYFKRKIEIEQYISSNSNY